MRRSRRKIRPGQGDVPVSSFSDIAFLLIIFFIVATTWNKMRGFQTDIPSGEKQEQQQKEQRASVNINSGQVFFNEQKLADRSEQALAALRERLANLNLGQYAENDERKVVLFEATGSVTYDLYYQVMAAISASGGVIGIVREE